jgi:hypothetical protein
MERLPVHVGLLSNPNSIAKAWPSTSQENRLMPKSCRLHVLVGFISQSPSSAQTLNQFIGMNTLRDIHKRFPTITKAFVITSSDTLIEGVKNLFNWTKNGFPETMLEGPIKERFGLLRDHLQSLDTNGLEVKFWKVAPEYLQNATF